MYMAPPKTQKPLPRPQHPYYKRMLRMKGKDLFNFVAGFVDGEGTFCVSLTRVESAKTKNGKKWILNPLFQVYQHGDHIDILYILRDHVFKSGRIHRKTSPHNVYTFSIENRTTLYEKIVPFFRKHQLATKENDFLIWAEIIEAIYNKEHLTYEGFCRILDLVFTLNKNGTQRIHTKKEILKTLKEQFDS